MVNLGSSIDDENGIGAGRASKQFLTRVEGCNSVAELAAVAQERKPGRSSTELGAMLYRLRQLVRRNRKKQDDPIRNKLLRSIQKETKSTIKRMPSRSIANVLFDLQMFGAVDKLLLAKAVTAIASRVRAHPTKTPFKVLELAQVASVYRSRGFVNQTLNDAIATNFLALPDQDLNPRSAANLLVAVKKLQIQNDEFVKRLVLYLTKQAWMLDAKLGSKVVAAAVQQDACDTEPLLAAVQAAICRQRPNRIEPLSAAILLRTLAQRGALQDEAAQVLIAVVQKEQSLGPTLQAVMEGALPHLQTLGYQVNLEANFSFAKQRMP